MGFGFGGYGGLGYAGYGYGGYGYGGYPYRGPIYHPITAVWVRSGSTTGLVPLNPLDKSGKTPINLAHGVYALNGNGVSATPGAPVLGEKWSVEKNPPKGMPFGTTFARATQPVRVSRTILSSNTGSRAVTLSRDSSIVYDAKQHSFVNRNTATKTAEPAKVTGKSATNTAVAERNAKVPNAAVPARGATMMNRPHINPPTPPMSAARSAESRGGESRGGMWSGAGASSPSSSTHSISSPSTGHGGGTGGGGGAAGGGHH